MCFRYPLPGSEIFGEIKPGSIIFLRRGAGNPPVEEDSTSEVIISVDGYSALTNTGRLLCCVDSGFIDAVGGTLAESEYEVSPEAQAILRQAEEAAAQSAADWQEIVDGFGPEDDPLELL